MSKAGQIRPLRGIIPPMATPLASIDQLDVRGVETLVEHVLSGGVHGLFLLGTTGEGCCRDGAAILLPIWPGRYPASH